MPRPTREHLAEEAKVEALVRLDAWLSEGAHLRRYIACHWPAGQPAVGHAKTPAA